MMYGKIAFNFLLVGFFLVGGRVEISCAEKAEMFFMCVVLLSSFVFVFSIGSSGPVNINYSFLLAHHFHGLLVGVQEQAVVFHNGTNHRIIE